MPSSSPPTRRRHSCSARPSFRRSSAALEDVQASDEQFFGAYLNSAVVGVVAVDRLLIPAS
jgi:hypothetical protein